MPPGDYPDYTDIVQIIGSDIMIPIDIQGAYIMMPVDIQGQYVNVAIDIVAQTIGNLVIDIEAQSVGIYLKADWEVLQGNDKNLQGDAAVGAEDSEDVIDYEIPTGKTFYIVQWGFFLYKEAGIVGVLLYKHDGIYTVLAGSGGMVGNNHSLTKPIAVVAGDHVVLRLWHYYAGTTTMVGTVGSYEI